MRISRISGEHELPPDMTFRECHTMTVRSHCLRLAQRKKEIQAELDEANAITIPEGAKLKWSDELGKMVWE